MLTDPTGIYVKVPFKFTVVEPPKFVSKLVKTLDLMASNEAYYILPVIEGSNG